MQSLCHSQSACLQFLASLQHAPLALAKTSPRVCVKQLHHHNEPLWCQKSWSHVCYVQSESLMSFCVCLIGINALVSLLMLIYFFACIQYSCKRYVWSLQEKPLLCIFTAYSACSWIHFLISLFATVDLWVTFHCRHVKWKKISLSVSRLSVFFFLLLFFSLHQS